ncbi:MAG: type II secretion system protein [Gammaproteobacteria bacterium]
MRARGFTLIEVIVVIVLLGIVGSMTASIISSSMEGYNNQVRRDRLQSSARLAIERIQREVRHALPNSICTRLAGSCNNTAPTLYFMRVKDAGRYQDQSGVYASGVARAPLPVPSVGAASSFDVISGSGLGANVNDWVVVYNLNNSSLYTIGSRRKQITGIAQKDVDGDSVNDTDVIQFASGTFPQHSPNRRFHIIEPTATLFYCQGGNLLRATSNFATPDTPNEATPPLLLENVTACSFTYDPGSQQRAGLLRIDLTITDQGETIRISHEVHVYNVS